MAERYATCATYRDSGKSITRFVTDNRRPYSSIKPFATAFIRPDRFRFEYRSRHGDAEDDWDRYIIWSDGRTVSTWWDVRPGVERQESLSLAVAAATGVSGGTAHTVSSLLFANQDYGRRLTDLVEVRSLEDEHLDGGSCYRLKGQFEPTPLSPEEEQERRERHMRITGRPPEHGEESPLTLWIDRESLLLRRLEEGSRFDTFRTEKVTYYDSQTDVSIDEQFEFDPPAQQSS